MLANMPAGSRAPIYEPPDSLPLLFDITTRTDARDAPPPPQPPPPPPPPQTSSHVTWVKGDAEMPMTGRAPSKKPDPPKMTSRRPPIYRPKSRTEGSGRLRGDGGGSSDEDLSRQNTDLRQRLQEEATLYRRRLDTYRQAQQNQAALVSRLQAKVLQYKQRCSELEAQMAESSQPIRASLATSALEQAQQHLRDFRHEPISDLDTALMHLNEERRKCERLTQLNDTLREQLEEAHSTNEALTNDLQKLTNDWEAMREEMIIKEDEWKDEEQAFNDYYSTEHNRLLNLWREVVSVKRLFIDVQTTTERDLSKVKSEVAMAVKDLVGACNSVDRSIATEAILEIRDKKQYDQDSVDLTTQLEVAKAQQETIKSELKMKEEHIQQLLRDMQNLEDKCLQSEQATNQMLQMQEEMELLQGALKDIAYALIQDAEMREGDFHATHVHLSAPLPSVPQKSPRRGMQVVTSPAALAESTISAVQAALHKYQSLIHELQVKLQSNKEQLLLVRKQCEHSEESNALLEQKIQELVAQLDACRTQCSQLKQEKESLQKSLEATRSERNNLERTRLQITAMYEALNADCERLQKANSKLQKDVESLHEDKIFLQSEIDRLNQEGNLCEISLRGEEDRCSRIREELLSTREELNKLYLSHDLLEQQKIEHENVIANLEKAKADCEYQLEKALGDKSSAGEIVSKRENTIAALETEKKKLLEECERLEDEKSVLQLQCSDHQNDMQSLRKELLQAEQTRLDLESEKSSLNERVRFLEMEKEKVEMELSQVIRERGDLSNQLTVLGRKKEALNEELMRTKQKLEQANETNARVNRNLEELVKECEERQSALEALEKELQRLQEQLAGVRSEKETLEGVLFDTQTNLEATEDKRVQLEKDNQDLLFKVEGLKGQVARVGKDLERSEKRCQEIKNQLSQQLGNQEAEFQQMVSKLKKQNEEAVKKLTEERESVRVSLEARLQQSLQQLGSEKDAEIGQMVDRIETLERHIENVCQQHEELMLRAENDKQQALLIAHHDQQALQERLESARRELEAERETLDRYKREANSKFEQDRNNINLLKDELNKHKAKLEEQRVKLEEERSKLEQKIEENRIERDAAQKEVENLKVQLNLCEDKGDNISGQLHETIRKLKEAENNTECLRKELTDVRRQFADATIEKEKYLNTNKELRDHVKRTESEKREQNRQLEEAYQKITILEDVKAALENEKSLLQSQKKDVERDQAETERKLAHLQEELKKAQSSGAKQQAEEKELQARLMNEIEERERAHQEAHQLKKQLHDLERNLEQIRQELGRTRTHSTKLEEQWHAREQDLLVHLEDSRAKEKRLEDQKHNLEVCLVDATQQIQELKAKLGGAEGRLKSLEAQLMQSEVSKREIEQKLASVISTLRRIAGVQIDGSVTLPYRIMSPSRRWSPARVHDDGRDIISDIDPENVRKGVRNLMQQVAQIERERDDYKTQIAALKKQLNEANDQQSKGDSKLNKLLQNLRTLQDEKAALESKLGQKSIALQSQIEALQKKTQESQELREKLTALELSFGSCNEDKHHLQEKIDKHKMALARLESEKRALQEELNRSENRATKLELQRMSAEGDLNRLQMVLQDKDTALQKLQEKYDAQSRAVASLEERCSSLKSTVDQLNLSLERAASTESELRSEIQSLQRHLLDTTAVSHSGTEKLKQLQKTLATAENERRLISERFDSCQQNLAELRRNNQILQDQVSRLNNELANSEVQRAGLESQVRLAQWPGDGGGGSSHREEELMRQLQGVQRERGELKAKVDGLMSKLRQLEMEKSNLERMASKTSILSKSYERPEKYEKESSSDLDSFRLEQENRELRVKIAQLENELTQKELELNRLRASKPGLDRSEVERYRAAQLQAEKLLEAREQSHRQQVLRLEQQVASLREQLNQEIKRRQQYVMRSSKAGREMQQLRQALGDSLRTVSQDPSLDALLLEHEARKLDDTVSSTASLPPALGLTPASSYRRSMTPQPPKDY